MTFKEAFIEDEEIRDCIFYYFRQKQLSNIEIYVLIARVIGSTIEEIAQSKTSFPILNEHLPHRTDKTIKFHQTRIRKKLNIKKFLAIKLIWYFPLEKMIHIYNMKYIHKSVYEQTNKEVLN